MAVKPQVKVAPERRGETRVWNITDDPATKIKPQSVMVLGRTLHPGRSMRVAKDRLEKAHKVRRDVEAGLLHVGDMPPQGYQAFRSVAKARLPRGVNRAHGPADGTKKAVAPKTQVKELEDKVAVRDSVKVAPKSDDGPQKKKK